MSPDWISTICNTVPTIPAEIMTVISPHLLTPQNAPSNIPTKLAQPRFCSNMPTVSPPVKCFRNPPSTRHIANWTQVRTSQPSQIVRPRP